MPDEAIIGMNECIRKLRDIGAEDGKFAKKGMRSALREGCKFMQRIILAALKSESGVTARNVKVRSGPRSRSKISMLVGVFGGAVKDVFYAGFSNYGHKTTAGKQVEGSRWTDVVNQDVQMAFEKVAEKLSVELAEVAGGK